MVDRIGQQLGNYRLMRLLGTGGCAEVYLGEHLYLKRRAAIKVLHAMLKDEQKGKFLIEAQRMAELSHPSIIRVFDFAIERDLPYLVMEYAPYGTLRTRHPSGSCLSLETIVPYVKHIAATLQYIHAQKLVHCDIKPENLLLGKNQEILLSDFGIAAIAHKTSSLTMQGWAGTPLYMAPEQSKGRPRAASDQYSLGIVVYEWLSGRAPFQGSVVRLGIEHLHTPAPPLRQQVPELSPAVEQVVLKALAKDPQQRFRTITEFAEALERASQVVQAPVVISPIEEGQVSSSSPDMPTVLAESVQEEYVASREVMPLQYAEPEPATLLLERAVPASPHMQVENNVRSRPIVVREKFSTSQSRNPAATPNLRTTTRPKRRGLPYMLGAALLILLAVGISIARFSTSWFSPASASSAHQTTPVNTPQPTQAKQQTNILAMDTFQRADQALWGQASDGRQWGGDANSKPSFSINGLKGQIAGGTGALEAVIGQATDNVDVTVSGSVNQFGNNVNLGVVLRWTDSNNWYKAFIDGTHLSILKSVKGQTTTIKQMDVKTSAGGAETLRFHSRGTMLSAKVWPTGTTEPQDWMVVVDDQTFTSGQFGIRVFEQPATVVTITSFGVTMAAGG